MNTLPYDPLFNECLGEPIKGKTYLADGWVYRDLPRLTQKTMQDFIDLVGEENVVFLTFAKYTNEDVTTVRGQILISPEGQSKILEAKNKLAVSE